MRCRLKRLLTAVAPVALLLMAVGSAKAAGLNTTNSTCKTVNGNIYPDREAVYLNGNPSQLDYGDYYVKVKSPGGDLLGL